MIGLKEIATSGSPGIVALLGMGTVFSTLVILYLLMHVMGRMVPRLTATRDRSVPAEMVAPETKHEAKSTDEVEIPAVITLALARHRTSRAKPYSEESKTADPWKMAGRLQGLRKR